MKELDLVGFKAAANSGEAAVFAFGAPWCRDCIKAQPWLEALAQKYPQVGFYHIDVDAAEQARDELSIRHIPTILFCKDGVETHARLVEPASLAEIESAVQSLL